MLQISIWSTPMHTHGPTTRAILASLLLTSVALAGAWPRFRGPNGQGISDATTIPVKWTDEDYAWKIDLSGTGPSSPVVWGDKVFVTCADPQTPKGILLALDAATGNILWRKDYPLSPYRMNTLNSYAATTPALAAERVYVLWQTAAQTTLVTLDHSGREIGTTDFGPNSSQHGPGASPVVVDDLVVFTHEQREGQDGCWIAIDAENGQTRWKLPRDPQPISYSTPCLYAPPGSQAQLVFTSIGHGVTAVAPGDGTILWEASEAFIARVVSSPVLADGLIIGSCGEGGVGKRLAAVEPPAGPGGSPQLAWSAPQGAATPYVPTCLYKDGLLYSFQDQGTVACRIARTGEILWNEKPAGRFYGSPVWLDNRLYCITREGRCVVLQAGRNYSLLAVNDLGEPSDATPAVADERMYLRTSSRLLCLAAKRQ